MIWKKSDADVVIGRVVDELASPESYTAVSHRSNHELPLPSSEALRDIVEALRGVLFPGYFTLPDLRPATMHYWVGATLERVYRDLTEQVNRGLCFGCGECEETRCARCRERADQITTDFIASLPAIRRMLATDVQAAFEGDPAAPSAAETVFCYPSIRAVTSFRLAHQLYALAVPLIPRIITEQAHSETGIDIHPGATIGERFFIDHGTGTVIGETCLIGANVRLYQGVTLGAKSFPLDEAGNPIKGVPRHPIVEDDVIVYAGATVLGRVTIGKGSVIGGNVWLTHSVPPGSRVSQQSKVNEELGDAQENGMTEARPVSPGGDARPARRGP
jgi:serine O-acetyltransferase